MFIRSFDKFEFIKTGMIRSIKIVLFVSPMFLSDSMCVLQQNIALAASLDERIPCIVPVLLEDVEDISALATLRFVNAKNSDNDDISEGVVKSVTGSDLYATMLPFECASVFARCMYFSMNIL
ncbi:uncharacterized protein LOC123537448 [Mercenaria mercenaria]|uniref:uncharacterized protein LOC123537448 n=1 Tax=Mercenaria mercenaria TaxID=6596 RepID=UPI00234E981A|nr:uncharacterized protein LOC123537448 [Mercenaria mercenaria]